MIILSKRLKKLKKNKKKFSNENSFVLFFLNILFVFVSLTIEPNGEIDEHSKYY